MSVYGGDSWAREAQHRKRRVDDLMLAGLDSSSFKKLSNGKFTCLVCPHRPLLDSSLMLSMHSKAARHRAALSKLQEKEQMKQEQIKKRVALSDHPSTSVTPSNPVVRPRLMSKPLIEKTRNAASEVLQGTSTTSARHCRIRENHSLKSSANTVSAHDADRLNCEFNSQCSGSTALVAALPQVDFRERREKELKFTAAGWKRDCHGTWYRDENVEFDSDEEDPNVCLA